jgi:hypothetical protein
LSDSFPIQNGLKQGAALSPLLFNFALEYAIRKFLVGKRPLARPRHRWVDNIRMNLGELRWVDVDWICLAQDRIRLRALVNAILNIWVP